VQGFMGYLYGCESQATFDVMHAKVFPQIANF
jgi:hypothetical protein